MPVAAAVVGSAIIGGGATIYASNQAKKAANKAQDSADRAAEQQMALLRENRDIARQLQDPYLRGGNMAWDLLLQELGVANRQPAVAAATAAQPAPQGGQREPIYEPRSAFAPQAAQPAGSDGAAYLSANPDVQAEYQRNMASGKGRQYLASIGADTPEGFANWHYQTFGQNEGRQMPQTQPTGAPADTSGPYVPTTPAETAAPRPGTDLIGAARPEAAPAPTFTRPQAGAAPDMQGFFSNFTADPGYKFRLDEALNGVNAASAARGKLRSGDAAKALMSRSSDLASQEYGNWFNRQLQLYNAARDDYRYDTNRGDANFADDRAYGTGMWQYQTGRDDQNFNTDRGYQTQQQNTRIGNLFDLANMGQAAAGAVTGANSNYAANAGNVFGSQAQSQADAAYAKAQANSQLAGGLASAAGNLFSAWGGGSRAAAAPASNLGTVNYGTSLNNPFNSSYSF